jgi:hypothetical protein
MPLNFYKLYSLLNENTVSQELKRFKQNKKFKEKNVVQNLIEEIKRKKFPPNTLVNISENGKNAIANWILLNYFKYKGIGTNQLKWLDNVQGKNDIRSAENYINNLLNDLTKILTLRHRGVADFLVEFYYDYIAASLDERGNLNQILTGKFNDPNFTMEDLERLSDEYHENLKKGKIRTVGGDGKTILEFPDGYKWIDLERGYCKKEAEAGRHCGNVNVKQGDTILSLRDGKNFVHLTFVLNHGVLEERKGYANSKPSEKLHPYIVELLKLPIIKHLGQGRYLPVNDFQLTDLSDEQAQELVELKPTFTKDYYRQLLISGKEIPDFFKDEIFDYLLEKIRYYPDFVSKLGDADLLARLFEKIENGFEELPTSFSVLEYLADNKNTPGETLLKLFNFIENNDFIANHKQTPNIKGKLVKNKNTPPEVLHKLAIFFVNGFEEETDKIPLSFKDKLGDRLHHIMPQGRLIYDIMSNPNVSAKTLEYLSSVKNKYIAKDAENKLKHN